MSAATTQRKPLPATDEATVPPGYKRTEVGVIPEDWKLVALHRVSDFITKGSTPTTYGFKWERTGILFLRSECVSPDGLDLDQSMFISSAANAMLRRSEVRDGDLLITITGNVGRVVLLTGVETANINQHIARIRISAPISDAIYIYHFLSQRAVRRRFELITTGQAYPQISLQQVREAEVALPSLPEQRAIAETLSDVDGLLGALEALIAKKRAIKQAAMQQLLTGKTRLPGFSGEWEKNQLGDILDRIIGGGTPSRSNPRYWGDEIPWVTVKDFATFNPREAQEAITKEGLANSATNLIPAGMLITSTRMALGKAVIYEVDVCINQDLKALFFKDSVSTHYMYYWFQYHAKMIDELGSGSTVKGLSIGDLQAIPFELTSLSEQAAITAVISDMDAEIAALERRQDKMKQIKQGMMQSLLTGRVRLMKGKS